MYNNNTRLHSACLATQPLHTHLTINQSIQTNPPFTRTCNNSTVSINHPQQPTPTRQGRQELPADYWKEFARLPYLVIGVGTLGAYLLHPFMQAGSWVVRG